MGVPERAPQDPLGRRSPPAPGSGLPLVVVPTGTSATRRAFTFPARTMGTLAQVIVLERDPVSAERHAKRAFSEFRRLDALLSNWTATSEVARIHRLANKGPLTIDREIAVVLAEALRVWDLSEGAFDITLEPVVRAWGFIGGPRRVPSKEEARAAFARVGAAHVHLDPESCMLQFARPDMRIDLGGIAKGYAVDAAARIVRQQGETDALIDISGNMLAIGAPLGAPAWRIGIRDPQDRVSHFARVALPDGRGISTSARYEQYVRKDGRTYGHIMDPRTGEPVEGFTSVTVLAPSAMIAEGWSTALFVLGPADARRVASGQDGIACVFVEPAQRGPDTVWVSESLREVFQLEEEARDWFEVAWF